MGYKWIMAYARENNLYTELYLSEIVDTHGKKSAELPVVAVDGVGCVWYLYGNRDSSCGGQYREFREACRNFVRAFTDCGVRLVFFFPGLTPAEEKDKLEKVSADSAGKVNQSSEENSEAASAEEGSARLPEGLIPSARVIFRDEPSAEVRLTTKYYKSQVAQYAATCKNCLGIVSSDGSFLLYKDVPCIFTVGRHAQASDQVRIFRYRPSDLASHLRISQLELPACATFMSIGGISSDEMRYVHGRLRKRYGQKEHLAILVAELVRNKTVEEMCRIAFEDKWGEFVDRVRAKIDLYHYKQRAPEVTSESSGFSRVVQSITAKHSAGEIPPVVLSVTKCRMNQILAPAEGLSHGNDSAMGEALRRMRNRMYAVLLWESGNGPFHVEELVTRKTNRYRVTVEVRKRLPASVTHPGLLQLWTGDLETRWKLFTWVVGAPDWMGSALRSLEPQCLVVPAAALLFLRHEARLVSPHESDIFAVLAVTVGKFSAQELSGKYPAELDPRAVFLSTLFVRTALHVLEAAAVCGLSFPRESDCQLDAYFDGKFFHELYLKAKAQSFSRVGTHASSNPSYLELIHKLLNIIEGRRQ